MDSTAVCIGHDNFPQYRSVLLLSTVQVFTTDVVDRR